MTHQLARAPRTPYIVKSRSGQVLTAINASPARIRDITRQLRKELGQEVRLCR